MPARRPAPSAAKDTLSVPAPTAPSVSPSLARRVLGWDWVAVLLASWLLPLLGFNLWPLSYLNSELFWVLPILALLPRFLAETHPGSRRRRAFGWAVLLIVAAGSALDLGFGRYILSFGGGPYLGELAGVPYEEFLFYLLGPVAMLLVYFWADQHLLKALAPEGRRRSLDPAGLLRFEPGLLAQAVALFLAGVALKAVLGGEGPWLPWYYSFLLLSAYLPVLFFWRAVRDLVNWPALSLTVLYTLVTSLVWEQSLALPLQWWGYQPRAMLGLWVRAWQRGPLPIEAVSVWVVAPFACVFFFEIIRRLHYHPGRSLGPKLNGAAPPAAPTAAPERPQRKGRGPKKAEAGGR